MEWCDEGVVLSARRHGETAAVVSLLTQSHGRHVGLVKGGAGKAGRGALQSGNCLRVIWKARLAEQLGVFSWELEHACGTAWLHDPARLGGVSAACAVAEAVLPERQAYPRAYAGLVELLHVLGEVAWPSLYVHWELGLLAELGYGLDLTQCAATGMQDQLAYVSPRSGCAVSFAAGEPYRDRLLALPRFLLDQGVGDREQVHAGLVLTGYFLERRVLAPLGRPLPAARCRLVDSLKP